MSLDLTVAVQACGIILAVPELIRRADVKLNM
jgi:hypothetical protein